MILRDIVRAIDVTDQEAINTLKLAYPGQGVGPLVQEKLVELIRDGLIRKDQQLPAEYRKQLSALIM